jgi:hypothetical protein
MAKGVEYLIKNRASLDLKGRLALLSAQIANGATMTAQEGRVLCPEADTLSFITSKTI